MSNKVTIAILSILAIFFLTAQSCNFGTSTGLAADCVGEGDIVCDDTEAYECGLAAYGTGYYVSRSSDNDAEYCGAVDTTDTDGDGVYDSDDVCEGYNDTEDNDADGTPDGCDTDDDDDGYTDRIELRAGSDPDDSASVPATRCTSDCGAYLCDEPAAACYSECTDGTECEDGYSCVSNVCTSATTGALEAVCSSDATTVEEMENIYFYGSSSTDDGTIVSYTWDFGDGTMGTTVPDTAYGYINAGSYTVTLTVTDDEGNTDDCTVGITVEEPAATLAADCGGTYTGAVDETITFDGTASTGDITAYEWDFGDGTTEGPTSIITDVSEITTTHSYSAGGTYTVVLVVEDASGDQMYCETTAEVSHTSYEATDVTDASIDTVSSTRLFVYRDATTMFKAMGFITESTGVFTDMSANNPTSATPLLIGSNTLWAGTAGNVVSLTTDVSTIDVYLPTLSSSARVDTYMLFYIADDGSTYYADSDHDGVKSDLSDLLTPEEAITADHLAQAAP